MTPSSTIPILTTPIPLSSLSSECFGNENERIENNDTNNNKNKNNYKNNNKNNNDNKNDNSNNDNCGEDNSNVKKESDLMSFVVSWKEKIGDAHARLQKNGESTIHSDDNTENTVEISSQFLLLKNSSNK
jgi:hypothetical protein